MDIASELADYLEDAGFGTVGTSIFVSQIPADTNGIWIVRSAGSLDMYLPVSSTVLDIYIKNTKAQTAITTLNNITNHIHRMHNTVTANSYIYSMLALGDIETLERDNEYAKIFKISVEVKHRNTALLS